MDSDEEPPSGDEKFSYVKLTDTKMYYETPPRPVHNKSTELNCVSASTTTSTYDNNNNNNNNNNNKTKSYYSNEELLKPSPKKFQFQHSTMDNKRKSPSNTALAKYLASQRKLAKSKGKNSGKKIKLFIGRTKVDYHHEKKEHYFFVVVDLVELQKK